MNVLEVVSPFLKNSRSVGDRVTALCPFHQERNPSFSMSLEPGKEGLYFCFSCHASGNLATFLRKMKVSPAGIDRTLKHLSIRIHSPRYKGLRVAKRTYLPEALLGGFHACPTSMLDAGFSMDLLDDYSIGFDNDRDRITFPLRDEYGHLIGISGRTIHEAILPRYLIYSDREFPTASGYKPPRKDFLWNFDRVYAGLINDSKEPVYIVEGFKVCLWLLQNGYHNTVALVGSTMTKAQFNLLSLLPTPVTFVLALDNDEAGRDGSMYIGGLLSRIPGARVRSVNYELMDSLELHQLDGAEMGDLQGVLAEHIPFLQFRQKEKRKKGVLYGRSN